MSHSAIIVSIWLDGKLVKTNRIVIATARGNVNIEKLYMILVGDQIWRKQEDLRKVEMVVDWLVS